MQILFLTNKLVTGGVELSLLNLVKYLSEKHDITVAVCEQGGGLYEAMSEHAEIICIPEYNVPLKKILLSDFKQCKFGKMIKRLVNVYRANSQKDYLQQCIYKAKIYERLEKEFDVAICFHKPTDLLLTYTLNNVNAVNKYLWVHTEFWDTVNTNSVLYKKTYLNYNRIICVSKMLEHEMIEFLKKNDSIYCVYNLLDKDDILYKSKLYQVVHGSEPLLVTVSRLSKEKGIDIALNAAKILKEQSVKFHWIFVGDGPMKLELLEQCKELGIDSEIEFVGEKKNPYPYMDSCDIYIQPSREEGFGMTVAEAKVFAKPIVVTRFLTATEHITDRKTGSISLINENDLADKIIELINDTSLRNEYSNNLKYTYNYMESEKVLDYIFKEEIDS